jgi:hypothetical protein
LSPGDGRKEHSQPPLRLFRGTSLSRAAAWALLKPINGPKTPVTKPPGFWEILLEMAADDPLPVRPNRREPRAVKRLPKHNQRLTAPRSFFQEVQHRPAASLSARCPQRLLRRIRPWPTRVTGSAQRGACQGNAWCVAFVRWCFEAAARRQGVANPLEKECRTGGVLDLRNRASGARNVRIPRTVEALRGSRGDAGSAEKGL